MGEELVKMNNRFYKPKQISEIWLEPHRGLMYFPVRKAGSQFISSMIKEMSYGSNSLAMLTHHWHGDPLEKTVDTLFNILKKTSINEPKTFTCVRDPLTRFISALKQEVFECEGPEYINNVIKSDKLAYNRIKNEFDLDMVEKIITNLLVFELNKKNDRWINDHFLPFHLCIPEKLDFVLHLENLHEDCGRYLNFTDTEKSIFLSNPGRNSSRITAKIDPGVILNSPVNYELFMYLYAEDYERFGYTAPK